MEELTNHDLEEKNIDKKIEKSGNSITYFGYGFGALVILATAGLYFYNTSLDGEINNINTEISQKESSIAELKNDSKLKTYGLIMQNKEILKKLRYESNITSIIKHMNDIEDKYKIEFKGFDYNSGKLSTSLKVANSEEALAYRAITHFIKEYRLDESSLFDLNFVQSISGHDEIKLSLSMDLKPTK